MGLFMCVAGAFVVGSLFSMDCCWSLVLVRFLVIRMRIVRLYGRLRDVL